MIGGVVRGVTGLKPEGGAGIGRKGQFIICQFAGFGDRYPLGGGGTVAGRGDG